MGTLASNILKIYLLLFSGRSIKRQHWSKVLMSDDDGQHAAEIENQWCGTCLAPGKNQPHS